MQKRFLANKKAEGETLVDSPVVFLVLNILFFSIFLLFIFKQSTGAFIYEQAYAKQISILMDSAKPGMTIYVNLTKGNEIAKKNSWDIKNIVSIDDEENKVRVKLANRGGYETSFFTNYKFDSEIENEDLVINFRDKTEEEKIRDRLDIIKKDYSDYEFASISREQKDIEKAILFAKENYIGNRKCLCGDECINYAKDIFEASENNKIDDALILVALMIQESSCENLKCNEAGYCGLMQISGKTSGYMDAKTNINEGTKELREKYELFKDGKTFEGACSEEYRTKYYSGWSAALRGYNGWGCNLNYPNQDFFVEETLNIYDKLKESLGNA